MYRIAILEEFHKSGLQLFDNSKEFKYDIINDVSEENLINILPQYDGCTLRVSNLTENILKKCNKLKVISRHGVGYDNVHLETLKKKNISLMITANANAIAVAEHVMYMMLSISKGIVSHDNSVRKGLFKKGIKNIQTLEINKKEILIVGFGRIGKSLIKICKSFDMKINIYDPYVDNMMINSFGCNKVNDLNVAFKSADYISLHVPLNDKTKNLINMNSLKNMKKNTIIINTARGGIVNEKDLDKALREKIIFGAGIDVFEKEPINLDNPLIQNDRVLLSPHSATFTDECKIRMAKQTVQNLINYFENKIDKSMVVKL